MIGSSDPAGPLVLVTGGYGFIGSNFVHRCLAEGAGVRILDCRLEGSGANPANLEGVLDRIEIFEGDVRDRPLLAKAVRGVDAILHCAAQTSHTLATADPLRALEVNCYGTLSVLEAIRQSEGNPKLVQVGTTTQIGSMIYKPADENHPEFPRDVYSATMVASEKLVLIYASVHGLPATVVRLPNTYGPRAAIHSLDLGFVNYFIGLGLQNKRLTVYGEGSQSRSLLYVDDAVEVLWRALVGDAANGEVFLAGSGRSYTVSDIARAIAIEIGGEVGHVPWPDDRKAIEVGDAVIDNAKATRLLGWKPSVDLESGLTRTSRYYADRLAAYLPD